MSETNDQRIYDRCIIRVGQLETENERLRELCKDMWASCHGECDYCPHNEGYGTCEFYRRMRDLGIEVG